MTVPTQRDVLMGKGRTNYSQHFGNQCYKRILRERSREYVAAPKILEYEEEGKSKATINREIVSKIKTDGGRFLKKNPATGLWKEVNDKLVVSKIVRDFSTLRKHVELNSDCRGVSINTRLGQTTEISSNTVGVELPDEDQPPLTSTLFDQQEDELRTALEAAGVGGGSPRATFELFKAKFDISSKISASTVAAAADTDTDADAAPDQTSPSSDFSFKVTPSVAEDPLSIQAPLNGCFARVSLGSPSTAISTCGTPAESASTSTPSENVSSAAVTTASGPSVPSTTLRTGTHHRQDSMFLGGDEFIILTATVCIDVVRLF